MFTHQSESPALNELAPVDAPFDLLLNTFNLPKTVGRSINPNVVALARFYHIIGVGDLTINGLPPDEDYRLGEYLIYGGRIRFDLSKLDAEERKKFFKYIDPSYQEPNYCIGDDDVAPVIKPRLFATHRRGELDANGNIAETKTGLWSAFLDLLSPITESFRKFFKLKPRGRHLGINLPIGGEGGTFADQVIEAQSGQWGHMYIYDDHSNGFMMMGIESSPPLTRNLRTGEFHSLTGRSENHSPFTARKINDPSLHREQQENSRCPISSTKGKYNWACVTIEKSHLRYIFANQNPLENAATRQNFLKSLTEPHRNSVKVRVEDRAKRKKLMDLWQKTSNTTNSISTWTFWGGVALTIIGVALTLSPFPPGVSQAIGAFLANIGIKTVAGAACTIGAASMVVGGGIGRKIRQTQAENARAKWNHAYSRAHRRITTPTRVPQHVSTSHTRSLQTRILAPLIGSEPDMKHSKDVAVSNTRVTTDCGPTSPVNSGNLSAGASGTPPISCSSVNLSKEDSKEAFINSRSRERPQTPSSAASPRSANCP